MDVLEGRLSQAALEVDSEVEEIGEIDKSEVIGMEEVGTTGGTQSSVMEVDEEEEDEVVVEEEVKRGETRKWAPSSPPKSLRKRVQAGMVTQMPAGSQVGMGTVGSTGKLCWRCIKHRVKCIVFSGGA